MEIIDTIINSVVEGSNGREKQRLWKVKIASVVKNARDEELWHPNARFAVSLGFSFHHINHGWRIDGAGNAKLDVENFVKPVIDAVAAGLFCTPETEPRNIQHWGYDDSNFNTLLIYRLPDADDPQSEGIAICVSSSSR